MVKRQTWREKPKKNAFTIDFFNLRAANVCKANEGCVKSNVVRLNVQSQVGAHITESAMFKQNISADHDAKNTQNEYVLKKNVSPISLSF